MSAKTPFTFGKIAINPEFTNRTEEIERLKNNISAGINTIIISPRRWGKSSLVKQVREATKDQNLSFCYIDLFNCRTEREFVNQFSNAVIDSTSGKWEEKAAQAKKFLGRLLPTINFSPDPHSDFKMALNYEEQSESLSDILQLPESIQSKKKGTLVVCIDEFQNIAQLGDSVSLQKKMRSVWQQHENVIYILCGSKRHIMIELFTTTSHPFYKFGDILFLQKISSKHWISFITQRFNDAGKTIAPDLARLIAELVENHPYYVQQLAQISWLRTRENCSESIIHESHNSLIDQLSFLFEHQFEQLSGIQTKLLEAIINQEKSLSSQQSLKKYDLKTAGHISRAKDGLVKKDIIDETGGDIQFIDPVFKVWLKRLFLVNQKNM